MSQIPPHYVKDEHGNWYHPSRVVSGITPNGELVRVYVPPQPVKPPKRIRQDSKPLMNKLELAFYAYLCAFFPSCKFHAQSIRFKLGNGIWYKPDVVCFDWGDKRSAACWEVKGPHAFRGGFENLKVAAYHYPEIRWTLVWKESERWQEQIVIP